MPVNHRLQTRYCKEPSQWLFYLSTPDCYTSIPMTFFYESMRYCSPRGFRKVPAAPAVRISGTPARALHTVEIADPAMLFFAP
jgi:hypothetical protein